jgi:hypothetical protein
MPPDVLNAAKEIPRLVSKLSPINANKISIPAAISEPRAAIVRLYVDGALVVSVANTAATFSGLIVAKKVVSAIAAVSFIV